MLLLFTVVCLLCTACVRWPLLVLHHGAGVLLVVAAVCLRGCEKEGEGHTHTPTHTPIHTLCLTLESWIVTVIFNAIFGWTNFFLQIYPALKF